MKFRCPYCKTIIGSELHSTCPQCGKAMKVPATLQKTSPHERKLIKQQIIRAGERKKQELALNTSANPLRKPGITIMMLMILAVVGALLVGRSNKPPKSTKKNPISRAILELRALKIASDRFYYDTLRYPTEEEGLKSLIIDPGVEDWKGPYVNIIKPDPWHNKYIYILSNNTVTVFSTGPDGIANTDDDVYPYK